MNIKEKKFKVTEDEDGFIIYDESDDYLPREAENEEDELDIEYLIEEQKRLDARKAVEQRKQRWVAVGVIAGVILFISAICYINFRNILF
ncbi:MAG: hypothetical protein K2L14_02220 [Duncaniella sp.]|nr:hypothetical protein [Duncaniella sp.]